VPLRPAVPASNRLTIAIDGTYVSSDLTNGLYQHYVVAGRIDRDGRMGGRFAYVAQRPDDALEFVNAAMQRSAEGAHHLLQVRCAVFDGQLGNFFREWFPGFRENPASFECAM